MKKRLLSAFLVLAMVLTLLPSAAFAAGLNDTEFHINGIQAMKNLVAENFGVDADDVTIHSVDVHGAKKNNPNKGDPAVATGGTLLNKYSNVGDVGARGSNGILTGYKDTWMVLNTSNVIDEASVDAITIYAKTGTWHGILGDKLDPVTVYLSDGAIESEQLPGKLITSIDVTKGSLDQPGETKYTLTYNTNGVAGAITDDNKYAPGTLVALNNGDTLDTEDDGIVFLGWTQGKNDYTATNPAEQEPVDVTLLEGYVTLDADITVYAAWAKDEDNDGVPDYQETVNTITVIFDNDAGTWAEGDGKDSNQQFMLFAGEEDSYPVPGVIPPEGQHFVNWTTTFNDAPYTLDGESFSYSSMSELLKTASGEVTWTAQTSC